MNAGNLNKRVLLQKPGEMVGDGSGGRKPITSKWDDVGKVWAEFKNPKIKEAIIAGAVSSEIIQEINIRRRSDVLRGWRVVWGERIFLIEYPYESDLETTTLVCREVIKGNGKSV